MIFKPLNELKKISSEVEKDDYEMEEETPETEETPEEPTEDDDTDYDLPEDEEEETEDDTEDEPVEDEESPEEDEGDTDYDLPDEDEEESEDDTDEEEETEDDSEEDSEDEGTSITDAIKSIEKELFKDLTEEQMGIRNKELAKQFLDVYYIVDNTLKRVNRIPKNTENGKVLDFCIKNLTELNDIVWDYMINTYSTRSYIQNNEQLLKFMVTLESINEILSQLYEKSSK